MYDIHVCMQQISPQVARDKAVKDAIAAGKVDPKDVETKKNLRSSVPLPLPET